MSTSDKNGEPKAAQAERIVLTSDHDGARVDFIIAPDWTPAIRINVGGNVVVKTARAWHEAAWSALASPSKLAQVLAEARSSETYRNEAAALSADRSQEPAAWLEVGEKSGVVGVSLERDDSSPFGWEPLYRAPVAPASSASPTIPADHPRCPLCRGPLPTDDKTLRERVAYALSIPMDAGVVLDPTDERLKAFSKPERERIIAAMCACDGISTPMLAATCPSWLDVVKITEERARELQAKLGAPNSAKPATNALGVVYLIEGKPHHFCDCPTHEGACPRGCYRRPGTAELGRCLLPTPDVLIAGTGPAVVVSLADIYDCDCNSSPHLKTCSTRKNRRSEGTGATNDKA